MSPPPGTVAPRSAKVVLRPGLVIQLAPDLDSGMEMAALDASKTPGNDPRRAAETEGDERRDRPGGLALNVSLGSAAVADVGDQDGLPRYSVHDSQVGDDRASVAGQGSYHGAAEFGIFSQGLQPFQDASQKGPRYVGEVGLGLRQDDDLHRLADRSLM